MKLHKKPRRKCYVLSEYQVFLASRKWVWVVDCIQLF